MTKVATKLRKGTKATIKAVTNLQKVTKKTLREEALKVVAQAIKYKAANCTNDDWPPECTVQISLTVAECRKVLKAADTL